MYINLGSFMLIPLLFAGNDVAPFDVKCNGNDVTSLMLSFGDVYLTNGRNIFCTDFHSFLTFRTNVN